MVVHTNFCFWRWGYYGPGRTAWAFGGIVFSRDDVLVAILCIHMGAMTWPKAWIPTSILDACDVTRLKTPLPKRAREDCLAWPRALIWSSECRNFLNIFRQPHATCSSQQDPLNPMSSNLWIISTLLKQSPSSRFVGGHLAYSKIFKTSHGSCCRTANFLAFPFRSKSQEIRKVILDSRRIFEEAGEALNSVPERVSDQLSIQSDCSLHHGILSFFISHVSQGAAWASRNYVTKAVQIEKLGSVKLSRPFLSRKRRGGLLTESSSPPLVLTTLGTSIYVSK